VTTRRHKYFYNAIEGTPFSLGLAIPEGYGMYEVLGEQEIKHSHVNGMYCCQNISACIGKCEKFELSLTNRPMTFS
jgi:hypothetical protein